MSLMGEHLGLQPATLQDVRIIREPPGHVPVTGHNDRHHRLTPHTVPAQAFAYRT